MEFLASKNCKAAVGSNYEREFVDGLPGLVIAGCWFKPADGIGEMLRLRRAIAACSPSAARLVSLGNVIPQKLFATSFCWTNSIA